MSAALQVVGPSEMLPPGHPARPMTDETAALQIVRDAARDPSVDIEKMQQLMAMRREIVADAAEKAFSVAMKNAQTEMRPVATDAANPQTKSRYATYAALDRVLRPIYTKHGFSLSFDEADSTKPDHIRVLCYVSHEDGHTRTYRKDMPADGKGAKGGDVMTKTHAAGAAASYGMRYLLKGIFNVAIGEDDRDGNAPIDRSTVSPEQVERLQRLIVSAGADLRRFLDLGGIERLEDMHVADFDDAVRLLKQKGATE